jgi:hypothetical protein
VADLHVLEDLGQRQDRGPCEPRGPVAGGEQQHPRKHHEASVHLDHARDVHAVAIAQLRFDLIVNSIEFVADLLELLGA